MQGVLSMKYDVNKAQVGDRIYGMVFEGLVEEYEVYLSPYADIDDVGDSAGVFWIKGNGIATTLRDNHVWYTTYDEAADECARYTLKVVEEYRNQIGDVEDLIRFMYDMFISGNKPRLNDFRKGIIESVIKEKARCFGINV